METWFWQLPIVDISSETAYVSQVLPTDHFSVKLISGALLHVIEGSNLGPSKETPTNGFVVRTMNHFGEGHVLASDEDGNPRLDGF